MKLPEISLKRISRAVRARAAVATPTGALAFDAVAAATSDGIERSISGETR
jgi:hypothetical protein